MVWTAPITKAGPGLVAVVLGGVDTGGLEQVGEAEEDVMTKEALVKDPMKRLSSIKRRKSTARGRD